jgi:hypothetical protein
LARWPSPFAAQAQQAGQTPPTEGAYKDNFGKFVRQGATYTHVIRFANSPKTTLIGYSRPRGGREKEDKVVLLQDIIRRLLASPKAYLQAGACIEFYNNLSDDDRDSVWIFTLHQGRAEPSHSASQLPWLMAYLEASTNLNRTPMYKACSRPLWAILRLHTSGRLDAVNTSPALTPQGGTNRLIPPMGRQEPVLIGDQTLQDRMELDDYLRPFSSPG